jgi:translation initiation factor 1 (eIF-1/SUI1)
MEFDFSINQDTTILKELKPVELTVSTELYGSKKKTRIIGLNHSSLKLDFNGAKNHLKNLKNKLNCNGGIDKETFEIHLFGDHKEKVAKYLVDENLACPDQITLVGVSKNDI